MQQIVEIRQGQDSWLESHERIDSEPDEQFCNRIAKIHHEYEGTIARLPEPENPLGAFKQSCIQGLCQDDLIRLLSPDLREQFKDWMRGQTTGVCEAKIFNFATRSWIASDSCTEPHGTVYYRSDVLRFLQGKSNW